MNKRQVHTTQAQIEKLSLIQFAQDNPQVNNWCSDALGKVLDTNCLISRSTFEDIQ